MLAVKPPESRQFKNGGEVYIQVHLIIQGGYNKYVPCGKEKMLNVRLFRHTRVMHVFQTLFFTPNMSPPEYTHHWKHAAIIDK